MKMIFMFVPYHGAQPMLFESPVELTSFVQAGNLLGQEDKEKQER